MSKPTSKRRSRVKTARGSAAVGKGRSSKTAQRNGKPRSTTAGKLLIGSRTRKFTALLAGPVRPVTVESAVANGGLLSAKLNTKYLVFQNGRAHAVVSTGQKNRLEWRVVGAAGISWSIRVTEPPDAGCGDSGTLDASGKEKGSCDFPS